MGNYRNLPAPARGPFPRAPLRWGTEPTGYVAPGINGQGAPPSTALSITQVSFGVRISGSAGTYPVGTRVAVQSFTNAIGLLSASLSTSIINATSDSPIVVIITRDVGPRISVNGNTDALVEHCCEQGLGHSFRSGVGFADDIAPQYGSQQNIGIYVASSGTGVAGNRITAIATLRYFPLLP